MANYVKITPLTRLEGHLGITARATDTIASDLFITQDPDGSGGYSGDVTGVSSAYSHGEMFRGLEKILIKRDPRDAPVITSRTCGVCHFIHRHTSLRNIENAAGWAFPMAQAGDAVFNGDKFADGSQPGYGIPSTNPRWLDSNRTKTQGSPSGTKLPVGAQLARNIVHCLTFIYSHAAHTIALAAPDYKALINEYVNQASGSLPVVWDASTTAGGNFFDDFYNEAVIAQRILHELLGFLGGKVPHQQSAIPGGFSRSFKGRVTTGTLLGGGTDLDAIGLLATKEIPLGGDPNSGTTYQFLDLSGLVSELTNGTGSASDANRPNILTGGDWISQRAALFTVALSVAGVWAGAHQWGQGSDNFVCAGTFDVIDYTGSIGSIVPYITGDQYFRAGVKLANGDLYGLDPTKYGSDTGGPSGNDWMFIYEDITSGKYPETDDVTGKPRCGGTANYPTYGYPGENDTHPLVGTTADRNTYTWYKGTRAALHPSGGDLTLYTVESGPHARLVVNGVDPHLNIPGNSLPLPDSGGTPAYYSLTGIDIGTYGVTGLREAINAVYGNGADWAWKSSTWNRLISRLQDMLMLIDMLIGSNYSGENASDGFLREIYERGSWLYRLDATLSNGSLLDSNSALVASVLVQDTPPYNGGTDWVNISNAKGCAYWDAPRGITCHFSKVENGMLSQYQHIAGTSWNGNGRDHKGQPGPFEWSLMGMTKVDSPTETFTDQTGGKYTTTLDNTPVSEDTVFIKYELLYGGNWIEYTATDVPKHSSGSSEGRIEGEGLDDSSYIVYEGSNAGDIELQFSFNYNYRDYSHIRNVRVYQYGYANNPVPTPDTWGDGTTDTWAERVYGHGSNSGRPNPLNVLRTIRSYDPCLACSVHVMDKEGKGTKHEAVPVAGWEVKENEE